MRHWDRKSIVTMEWVTQVKEEINKTKQNLSKDHYPWFKVANSGYKVAYPGLVLARLVNPSHAVPYEHAKDAASV